MSVQSPPETAPTELIELFPPGAAVAADGVLTVAGCRLSELAQTFGTPLYVVDEHALRAQVRRFKAALAEHWPNSQVVFASKAYPCTAVLRVMAQEGAGVDVAGGGELFTALHAGVAAAEVVMHGNAKTDAEIELAVQSGVGTIVVDNFDDIDRLERIVSGRQRVLVRVLPGVQTQTHASMQTGQAGSKFGLPISDARAAIERIRASERLVLDGIHVHIGSQILSTGPFTAAVAAIGELGEFDVYDLGGGLGIRYTYDERPPGPEEWIEALAQAARDHLPPEARILVEPGRSLVARAGLTLYRVVTVKRGAPTFVAVDGGMADNLEVALTGQRLEAAIVDRVDGGEPVELVGRQCESGDRLISGVRLPDPVPGDLIAVPCTGAYSYTLANNYNGALRPPVVFVADGQATQVVRRETYPELIARDL